MPVEVLVDQEWFPSRRVTIRGFCRVSVLAPARRRSTWLASFTFGSVQLRPPAGALKREV